MGNESRVRKSLRNTLVGMSGLIVSLVVSFLAKSVFVRLLGAEYNGVNGLFTNILQVLSLAELGFATSIAYALYKPLNEKDERTTAALMNYFAKIYRVIAIVVAVAGCCCIPLLQYLIAEDISELPFSLNELRGYFAIYLANTVCSYLLAYKRTIITADQNNYIISGVDNACNIALNIVQIILLLLYKNYYVFLIVMLMKTILNNMIIQFIAAKKYPYLRRYKKEKVDSSEKKSILKNVEALFLQRVGSVAITGTTSIIISAFVSLIDAGKYSNYLMITSNVNALLNILFTSITASVGNLCASENEDVQYSVFKRVQYISFFFMVLTFSCYLGLFNSFIEIWVGKDMVMGIAVTIAISLSSAINYLRMAVQTFKDGKGMFRLDWYKPIITAVVGIGLAIGLSYVWGTFGVILGYTIALLFVMVPIENVVLFKYGFHKKVWKQFVAQIIVMLLGAAIGFTSYYVNSLMPDGIGWFMLKALFSIVFTTSAYIVVTCRTEEFKYYKVLVSRLVLKVIERFRKRKPSNIDKSGGSDDNGDDGLQ